MARDVVGSAYIVVRALTDQVENDIRRGFSNVDKVGQDAGRRASDGFGRGFNRGGGSGVLGKDFARLEADAERARLVLRRLTITNLFLTPAIIGVVGAIGSLVAALGPLATILSRASQSAVVLGSSLSAILQGAIVAKVGIGGVADAIKAGIKAKDEEEEGNDRIKAALDRVTQARIRLRNIIDKEAPARLAAAREAAAMAEERAADAVRSSERALLTYNKAQENTFKALEALNEARERAKERIQQLRFEVEGGAISERRARLEFEKARDALQRVQDLPPNSRARQEAELAFAQADLNLRKAIDRNRDLKKEEAAATKAGVEGSQEVVAAKQRIEDSIIAERDAQIAAAKAQLEVQRARKAADEAAAAAAENGSVQREIDEQIAQARKSLKDALEDLEDVQKGSGSAAKEFEDALKELSPAAREFVLRFIEVKDEFKALRTAASQTLFPGVTRSLNIVVANIERLRPLFASTGRALGYVADNFTRTVFEGENIGRLERVWETNNGLIRSFGRSFANLYTAILAVLDAARPLAERFGAFIERITGNWAQSATSNTDALTERFNFAGETASRIAGIFRDLWEAFSGIGVASVDGGAFETLLSYFEDSAEGFREFIELGQIGDQTLGEYLNTAAENAGAVLSALSEIIQIFTDLGGQESTGDFARSIEEAAENFSEMLQIVNEGQNGLGDFIVAISELFLALAENESFGEFFRILTDVIEALTEFIQIPTVKKYLDEAFAIFAVIKAYGLLVRIAKFLGLGILGNVLKPFQMLKKGKENTIRAAEMVGKAWRGLKSASETLYIRWLYFKDFITQRFLPAIRNVATRGAAALRRFATSAASAIRGAVSAVGRGIARFGRFVASEIANVGRFIGKAFSRIAGILRSFVGTVARILARFLGVVKTALINLVTLLKANPWVLIVIALIALVVLVVKNWDKIKEYVGKAAEWVREKVGAAWDKIKEATSKLVNKVKDFFSDLWEKIKDSFRRIKEFLWDNHPMIVLLRAVREKWPEIVAWFVDKVAVIVGWFTGLKNRIKDTWSGFWDGLKDGFKDAINSIIRKWNDFRIEARIPSNAVTRPLGLAGAGFEFDTPNIPLLAKGGIIPPTRGGTLALIGEAGRPERVEPLDSDGLSQRDKAMIRYITSAMGGPSGGNTINVYPSPGMDERELAEMVSRRLAYQMRVGAA